MPDALDSIRSDIAAIRDALVRLGKLPAETPAQPRQGSAWVNIYEQPDGTGVFASASDTRADCDVYAEQAWRYSGGIRRIACVRVDWTEGQGLDMAEAS